LETHISKRARLLELPSVTTYCTERGSICGNFHVATISDAQWRM